MIEVTSKIEEHLLHRTTTSFGISIGTGLALEALFEPIAERYDSDRVVPDKVDVNRYEKHYFNVYTLVRNIVNAIPDRTVYDKVLESKILLDTLSEELSVIATLYEDTKCKPILFVPNYKKVWVGMNIEKGEIVSNKEFLFQQKVDALMKRHGVSSPIDIVKNTYKLNGSISNTLITSHLVVDLLNYRKVSKLALLESHTGVLKDRKLWYTKFHKIGNRTLMTLPFVEEILYILGDKHIVKPLSITIRRALYEYSVENRWSPHNSRLVILSELTNNEVFQKAIKKFKPLYD